MGSLRRACISYIGLDGLDFIKRQTSVIMRGNSMVVFYAILGFGDIHFGVLVVHPFSGYNLQIIPRKNNCVKA